MPHPRLAGLWRHPEFMKLWAGQTISIFGTRIDALGFMAILALGASPVQMGLLGTVEAAPLLVIGPLAGVWVDRLRRRPVMIAADLLRATLLVTVPVAAALGVASIGQLFLVGALVGALSVLFEVAYRSLLPSIVRREQLVEANARLSLSGSIAEVTGPGLSGVLVQILTAPVAILVDALTFLTSALLLGLIRSPEARVVVAERPGTRKELAEGFRMVLGNPILRAFAGRAATSSFFGAFFGALYSLYLIRVLGISPAGVGVTVAFGGIGELIGAALAPRLVRRLGIGRSVIAAWIVSGAAGFLIPLARGPIALAMAMLMTAQLFGDMAYPIVGVPEMSLRQTLTPDRLLGRVNATMQLIGEGVFPFGLIVGGALGQAIGIRQALWVAVVGGLLALPWILFSPIPRLRELPAD